MPISSSAAREASSLAGGLDGLLADVVVDHLGDDAVHGATVGCRLLQQLDAGRVLLGDRALQGANLARLGQAVRVAQRKILRPPVVSPVDVCGDKRET